MNILITGGAGFIGSRLALDLISRGHAVRVLDNLSPQIHGQNPMESPTVKSIEGKVDLIKGDVRNRQDWERCIDGIDCVVHYAAETGTGQSMYEIHRYMDTNVGGTAHLLDLVAEGNTSVTRVVVASSRAVYGEGAYNDAAGNLHNPSERKDADLRSGIFNPTHDGEVLQPVPTKESTPFSPTSIYGQSKQMQEQMVLLSAKANGISGFALRYQNVYGPGQSLNNPYTGIISIFSKLLIDGRPINIFEDGEESRDFVFISDVVEATRLAIEFEDEKAVASLNVGSGIASTVMQVAETLKAAYGSNSELNISGQYRIGDIRHNMADTTLADQMLGFRSKVDLATGLSQFAEWVRSQELTIDDSYEKSLEELKAKGLLEG